MKGTRRRASTRVKQEKTNKKIGLIAALNFFNKSLRSHTYLPYSSPALNGCLFFETMAEEGEEAIEALDPYKIVFEGSAEELTSVKKDGKATASYPNKDTFTGVYKDGKRNGQGTYTWTKANATYTGEDHHHPTCTMLRLFLSVFFFVCLFACLPACG